MVTIMNEEMTFGNISPTASKGKLKVDFQTQYFLFNVYIFIIFGSFCFITHANTKLPCPKALTNEAI